MSADFPDRSVLMLSPSDRRTFQDELLRRQIALCYDAHPFYARVMRAEGLTPDDITTCSELERLPVTTKSDFLNEPEAFRLGANDTLTLDEQLLWDVIYTTGTTSGIPAPIYSSTRDYWRYLATAARSSDFIDLYVGDVVVNLFPLTPFPTGAFMRLPAEAAACGAAVVAGLPGRANGSTPHRTIDEIIDLALATGASVLVGVAGFVRRFLIRMQERDLQLPRLRMCTLTGEASSEAFVRDVVLRMRDVGALEPVIVNRYGSTEQGTSMVECARGAGFHDLAPDQILLESVALDDERRLPDGESGRLVISHLVRRGTVFLRYAVGDIATLTDEPCERCDLSTTRMTSQPVRTKDLVKLKGTLVNVGALRESLEGIADITEYQFVVAAPHNDPLGPDDLLLKLASPNALEREVLVAGIVERIKVEFHVSPRVQFVEPDEIFDPVAAVKPNRFVDLRSSG